MAEKIKVSAQVPARTHRKLMKLAEETGRTIGVIVGAGAALMLTESGRAMLMRLPRDKRRA
jgi:hypothetical protein